MKHTLTALFITAFFVSIECIFPSRLALQPIIMYFILQHHFYQVCKDCTNEES